MSDAFRFLAKVDIEDSGCWIWKSHRNQRGYGLFWFGKRAVSAHRLSWTLFVEPIPDGLQVDHLCRVPSCVNPDHLEPVTPLENSRRGRKGILHLACKQGHPMSLENTLTHSTKRGAMRKCRTCQNESNRRYRARLREESVGA